MNTKYFGLKMAAMAVMALALVGCGRNSAPANESMPATTTPQGNQPAPAAPAPANAGSAPATTNTSAMTNGTP